MFSDSICLSMLLEPQLEINTAEFRPEGINFGQTYHPNTVIIPFFPQILILLNSFRGHYVNKTILFE